MDGVPVYLASLSRKSIVNGRFRPVPRWTDAERVEGIEILRDVLRGAGDETRERHFRMNVTVCIHRALRDDELARLAPPPSDAKMGLAGGPVEVLWENVPGSASTKPCENPTKHYLEHGISRDPLLWVPIDCQSCDSCRARHRLLVRPHNELVLPR